MSSMTVTVWGVTVDVEFSYHPGWPGNREEPPEYAYVETDGISIGGEEVGDKHLTDDFISAIETAVLEALREKDCDE